MIERVLQNAVSVDQMRLLRICCGFWSWQWQRHPLVLGRGGEWWNQRRMRDQTGRSLVSLEMPWLEEIAIWESSWQLMLKIEIDCRGDADPRIVRGMFVYISRGLTDTKQQVQNGTSRPLLEPII